MTQLYSPSAYYLRTEQALQYFLWVCRITNKHRLGFFFFAELYWFSVIPAFFYVLFFEDFRSVKPQTIRNKASQWRMLDIVSAARKTSALLQFSNPLTLIKLSWPTKMEVKLIMRSHSDCANYVFSNFISNSKVFSQ